MCKKRGTCFCKPVKSCNSESGDEDGDIDDDIDDDDDDFEVNHADKVDGCSTDEYDNPSSLESQ